MYTTHKLVFNYAIFRAIMFPHSNFGTLSYFPNLFKTIILIFHNGHLESFVKYNSAVRKDVTFTQTILTSKT